MNLDQPIRRVRARDGVRPHEGWPRLHRGGPRAAERGAGPGAGHDPGRREWSRQVYDRRGDRRGLRPEPCPGRARIRAVVHLQPSPLALLVEMVATEGVQAAGHPLPDPQRPAGGGDLPARRRRDRGTAVGGSGPRRQPALLPGRPAPLPAAPRDGGAACVAPAAPCPFPADSGRTTEGALPPRPARGRSAPAPAPPGRPCSGPSGRAAPG